MIDILCIDILYILSNILLSLHSFHLTEFQIHFFGAENTFELALKVSGHPTDFQLGVPLKDL